MAKAVISSILQSQLGKYVDGLAPESLQVGLWSGELLLTNLKLKPLALAELNLPIKVLQGTIGKVHVIVPWNQLGSASVQITLEGIYGVAVPNTELPSQEEVLLGIRNRLERAELLRQHALQTSSTTSTDSKDDDSTFLTRLTTRIIDNLQITIKDLHIRYEDLVSNPAVPFTCGLFFERFSLETTDEAGRKIFVDNTAGTKKGFTHKVAQVQKLALYWDQLNPADSMQRQEAAFDTAMRRVIYATEAFAQTDKRWLLVPPCTVRVRLTKNESRVYSKAAPKFAVHAVAQGLSFALSREQYDDMLFMHKAFLSRRAVEAHFWEHRHRPFLPLKQYPVVWWDYATRFVVATSTAGKGVSRFRWSVMKKMARDRKMYVTLYKQAQLAKTPALLPEQVAYVQRMEDSFPMELVLRLREVAEAQFAAQKKAAAVAPAASSWYGYFFGEAPAADSTPNDVLSAAGKADLKRAYEETVALAEAALPADCYLVTVDVALENGQVALYGYGNAPLLSSGLTGAVGIQAKPDQSWTAQLRLDRLDVRNHRVSPTCESHHFCLLKHGASADDVPFALGVAMPTPATLQVRLSAEPLQLVLDPVFVLQLYDFFCGSVARRQLDDVWAFATSSVQAYVFAEQEEADMLAAVSAMEAITYDVIIDMKAPVILVPEDATSDASAVVVFDFGRLKLTDVAPAVAHARAWQLELSAMQVLLHAADGFAPAAPGVALVPRFSMTTRIDSHFREVADQPLLNVSASLPALTVALSETSLLLLGRMHAAINAQCATAAPRRQADDDNDATTPARATTPAKALGENHIVAASWTIETIDVDLADSFHVRLRGTSFGYDLFGTQSSVVAELRELVVEDRAHEPTSPYFYLAKTPETAAHLIRVSLVASSRPDRAADTVITAAFEQLDVQWNPASIAQLYALYAGYAANLAGVAPAPLAHQSSSLAPPATSPDIPALRLSATLAQVSVALNKDGLDRQLATVSMACAALEMMVRGDDAYEVSGSLGNFVVIDHSVAKLALYDPFVGLDPAQTAVTDALLRFRYEAAPLALPQLDAHLQAVRIVYVHQQLLELVDYLLQGVLGLLVNATLQNATQRLLQEAPAGVQLHVAIAQPRVVVPMAPLDADHLFFSAVALELSHSPASHCAVVDGAVNVAETGFPADVKRVELDQVELFSVRDGRCEALLEMPLQLDIAIKDIVSTTLRADGVLLPRFTVDCAMPTLNLKLAKYQYIMLVRVLQENLGAAALVVAPSVATTGHRPTVAYDYARTDLEMVTIALGFSMAAFSCTLEQTELALSATALQVALHLLPDVRPRLVVGLSNFGAAHEGRPWLACEGHTGVSYEWDEPTRWCGLDVQVANVAGTVLPRALVALATFVHLDAAMLQSPAALVPEPAPAYEFHITLHASKVGLSFPSDVRDLSQPLLTIESDFDIVFDSFPPARAAPTPQRLVVQASQFETYLRHTNRQGCATSFVQIMEPTAVRLTYQVFSEAQEKLEVAVSAVQVFVSYEDTQLALAVLRAMQADAAAAAAPELQASVMQLNLVKETQRHMTWDVQSMTLTLINDCNGCDMGLLQLRLPTCRLFVNAATTLESSTVTGGGDLSFEATYYNPEARAWQPLCAEWKLNATVMATLGHVKSDAHLNSMQWTVSADPLNLTVTHGLLEALTSAAETRAGGHPDLAAPCTLVNESGLPLRFWWSAHADDVREITHGARASLHYVHVQGRGSGVTRTYSTHKREQGTVCLDLVGLGCQPLQGIVAEQLGVHGHTLVELSGGSSNFRVTCTSELVGGHIVLTISSHVRIHSHVSEKVQLLVYDPSWNQPMDIGIVAPGDSVALPVMYSLGSEIRLRCLGPDWSFSSPIPLDMSSAALTVSCTHPNQVAYFSVSFENGHVHLHDPLTIENKCPVPIAFQARDGSHGSARGCSLAMGAAAGVWWAQQQPLFLLEVPGCDPTAWLPLKRDSLKPFSLVVRRRLDRQPMTLLVALRENAAKALTLTLFADVWLINRTGVLLAFGNENEEESYSPPPDAQCVIDGAPMTMYSSAATPAMLRVRLETGNSQWSPYVKADPRRLDWQEECLGVVSNGRLHEFGVAADYATRHFGVLTTLVTLTPRYLLVNRSPWTIVLLEEDGALPAGLNHVDHMVPAGESYALYWMQGSRRRLRASVVDCPGTSCWSEPFGINELRTMELLVPNDVSCPILQVVVKQGGLSQSTFVIDMVNLDLDPPPVVATPSWDLVTLDVKVASVTMTLLDTSKEVDLFTGPVLEEVARFKIYDIRFDVFKDRANATSNLRIGSMTLHDLLPQSKYPLVLSPSRSSSGVDFIVVSYKDKAHPKYHVIEALRVQVQNVTLQTSMSFVNRINALVTETLAHVASPRSLDLRAYFAGVGDDLASLTGRKWFFETLSIRPIHATVSFVKDARTGDNANFWLAHLKLKIKDASLVLDGYTLQNALATQESVIEALSRFYVGSVKSQALGLLESIQVIPLVTGVVTGGVSTLVSTLWGKADAALASSTFRKESLSNGAIVAKHARAMAAATSPAQLQTVLHHLVFDWDANHTGLEARACMALGLVNNSSQAVVVQAALRDGAELRMLPPGRQMLAPGVGDWHSDRSLLLFAWGYTPTLLTTGDVAMNVQSNAFTLTLSKTFTRLQANPGYTATFTLQESQSWWAKHMVVVSDDLPSGPAAPPGDDGGYEVLFTGDTLGIVARQLDHNTVVVRECCRFANGQPSPALACGLIADGDTILSVNGLPVRTTNGFKAAIVNTARPIVVRFARKPADNDDAYSLFG
ncbi:vacuolar protein sorting-associated protein [Achlya hypogyna]|uniref:Vacuolar protein sorting-associated protein n=1 Tax=Achlya hypogyna TaxID=1202772 RepID=A0A1V9Z455_ACHHY|nr:vacuolar protein sorting-associated protein [Achlya hypogyna]